jgi:hypothetical protein
MLTYSRVEFEIDYNKRHNIKTHKEQKKNSNEFSKPTYIIITATTFVLIGFIYLQILL